ncbi:MAG: ABC transporter permease [Rhizobiales bacterium]|nr:ABC transporter permease [Hyphomicrobiales bacterium]
MMGKGIGFGGEHTATVIAVAIFATFAATAGEYFLTLQNLENVTRQVSLDAPLVFGQTIVLIAGGIDISVGATMAMAAALAIGLQEYGTLTAVLAALAFGALVGAFNGLLVTRGGIVPFVATLGSMSVIRGLLLTYTGQQPLSGTDDAFVFWGGESIGIVPVPLILSLVILAALALFLGRTRTGRNIYAIGGNREAAYLAGIAVRHFEMLAFVLSGTLAAVSGVLLASRLNSATVQLGNDTALLSISAALIGGASLLGGRGTVVGAFLGVLALGMLTNGMNLLGVHTYYQIATKATILIAVVALDALQRTMARRRQATAAA